jgi:hypothetical protein
MSSNKFNAFDNVFLECFGTLEGKKYKNKQHRLVDVVAICICATLSGMTNFIEIYEFAIAHEECFKKYLLLSYGIPSHDTLNCVM